MVAGNKSLGAACGNVIQTATAGSVSRDKLELLLSFTVNLLLRARVVLLLTSVTVTFSADTFIVKLLKPAFRTSTWIKMSISN